MIFAHKLSFDASIVFDFLSYLFVALYNNEHPRSKTTSELRRSGLGIGPP